MEAGALVSRDSLASAVTARVTARVTLVGIVAASFVARAAGSIGHVTPRYFPDEYIYAALGRSLGTSGRPLVRGVPAHFPALLEPLLAAPLWALAPLGVAYRLVQLENALFMSLAAVPAYCLARELRLSARYALLCAAFAVATPDLLYSSFVTADPVAYPLVIASISAGVVALSRQSRRAEAGFVACAALATAARVQYVVLFAAFGIAAVLLERRRVLRSHPVFAAAAGLGALAALAFSPSRLLGYYSGVLHLHLGASSLKWALTDLFLLTLASGAVLVPGAVAGIVRPRGRAETAFALLTALFGAAVLFEAALYASNGSSRFQERYLFTLLPLVPIAFGLYARRERVGRMPQLLVAAAVVIALPRVPISGYAAGAGPTDSPFLFAIVRLVDHVGAAGASIVVAAAASLAVVAGVLPRARGSAGVAVLLTVAIAALTSVGATLDDVASTRAVRQGHLASDPSWVDRFGFADVVAVQTPDAPPWILLDQLFWNTSVKHELRLGDAPPTDFFATDRVRIADDGSLRTADGVVRSPILFQNYALSTTFTGATRVAAAKTYTLWKPTTTPRLRVAEFGRYSDGWLAWNGRVTVWPAPSGLTRGRLSFTLSLPRHVRTAGAGGIEVWFGGRHLLVLPGAHVRLSFELDGRGPQTVRFASSGGGLDGDLRKLSVRSTMPAFAPLPGRSG